MTSARTSKTWSVALLVLAGLLSLPATAAAHAEHYGQSAYVTLTPDLVKVELDMSPGMLVASQVVRLINVDGDQRISEAEKRAYASALLGDLSLEIDGQPRTLTVASFELPPAEHLATGEDKMRFTFTASLSGVGAGPHQMVFRNGHQPARSAYLTHPFAGTREVTLGKLSRDTTQQQMTVSYAVTRAAKREGGATSGLLVLAAFAIAGIGNGLTRWRRPKNLG